MRPFGLAIGHLAAVKVAGTQTGALCYNSPVILFATDYSAPGLLPKEVLDLFDSMQNVGCNMCLWIS